MSNSSDLIGDKSLAYPTGACRKSYDHICYLNEKVCLPRAILCATVYVSTVIQQVLDYAEPAAGASLMESTVTGVVSVIHLAYSVLQAVQHHLLKRASTQGE